jgi:hypothetical protein
MMFEQEALIHITIFKDANLFAIPSLNSNFVATSIAKDLPDNLNEYVPPADMMRRGRHLIRHLGLK